MPSGSVDIIHGMVFAQLLAYINDIQSVTNVWPVFKLTDLKTYVDQLQEMYGPILPV